MVPPRGFVATAGLHAHRSVLHQVVAPDAVGAADGVEARQQRRRTQGIAIQRHWVARRKLKFDHCWGVGGILRGGGPAPHGVIGCVPRVLQPAAFVGDVQQVGVHGVRRLFAALVVHGNLVPLAEGHQRLSGVQVPLPPRRDHLDIRVQGVGTQLESHLVVALARGAVGDGVRAGLLGNLHQPPGDQRAGDAGAQQILPLVEGVGTEHGEDVVAHERSLQILDVDFPHPHGLGLGAGRLHLLALADVGGEGHHLGVVGFLQPAADNRGVQPPGIGQHDLLNCLVGHLRCGECQSGKGRA